MSHFFRQYRFIKTCLLLLLSLNGSLSLAQSLMPNEPSQVFVSANEKTTLIELYTSEGCSSCPPADLWLSALKSDPELFKSVIPMAFHVDYWNYLGWKDPFAEAANSDRQRRHKQQGNSDAVYTPGFVIDGQEWRGYFNPMRRSTPPIAEGKPGRLMLSREGDKLTLDFSPLDGTARSKALLANFVYLATDLEVGVQKGENRGKQLKHDFVVLSHEQQILLGHDLNWQTFLAAPDRATAVAAWISTTEDLSPIQAVGGWINHLGQDN